MTEEQEKVFCEAVKELAKARYRDEVELGFPLRKQPDPPEGQQP